jgi:predicted alpha/beta-fold hydrolase
LPGVKPYVAPGWLPGGHLQTVYPALFFRPSQAAYRRERWETPDGDFIDLDWVDTASDQPLVVLFHGLEGSSRSHYARSIMRAVADHGWAGVTVNFRGCSGVSNRLPRAYHCGDSQEIDWILRRLKERQEAGELYAMGVSLGGNALLKWLGERGAEAGEIISAAAAVSAPLDVAITGDVLGRGLNLVYARHFLTTLKKKSLAKLAVYPGLYDAQSVRAAATLRVFDDLVTAPLHGFRDADDYWRKASSKPLLQAIRAPTLIINACNDPLVPEATLPAQDQVSEQVILDFPKEGGHAGFVTGAFPGRLNWLPARVLDFLTAAVARP